MIEDIEDNSIIICNNNYKEQILKKMKKIVNIKFMTIEEFIKNYYFSYDEKAILYLIKKYNINYDIALEYLNNLIKIVDINSNNKKIKFLNSIKNELDSNNLLIYNLKFKDYIKNKKIIIYKYELSRFLKYLLKDIKYEIINKKYKNYEPKVFEFDTDVDEINYVANTISKLIDSGVDISNIKIIDLPDEYMNSVNKIFNFYNLKINKQKKIPIISNVVAHTFYNNLSFGKDIALKSIEQYSNTDTYNKIIDILNKYVWCDLEDLKLLVYHDLNNTYLNQDRYTNEIEIVSLDGYDFTDEYAFILGFNQGVFPKLLKDEDYINDSIKPEYLENTIELNKRRKQIFKNLIKSIKNLTITYKNRTTFNTYFPSLLIDELNIKVIKCESEIREDYGELSSKIRLAELLDNLIKFNENSSYLSILNSNYSIPYNTYSNKFTNIDSEKIRSYINKLKKFNLSYSSMDNYNRCGFRFYIDKILNLKTNLDKFSVELGSIYHYILMIGLKNKINIEEEVNKYIKKNEIKLDSSKQFFLSKAISNLYYLIDVLNEQKSYSKLDLIETEKNISINIRDNINFVGFIDKIMYTKKDLNIIAAIVDYKTYVKKPSLRYAKYGIGLQLPTYMLLSKYAFKDIRFVGFYLQNIILNNLSDEEKKDSLKLIGYTNSDRDILELLDYNYKDSKVIANLKVNNDGSFSSNSLKRIIDDSKIDDLIDLTKEKIDDTIDNIMNANFNINPKYDNENIGCEFCYFKDLCYKTESDYVKIIPNEEI